MKLPAVFASNFIKYKEIIVMDNNNNIKEQSKANQLFMGEPLCFIEIT